MSPLILETSEKNKIQLYKKKEIHNKQVGGGWAVWLILWIFSTWSWLMTLTAVQYTLTVSRFWLLFYECTSWGLQYKFVECWLEPDQGQIHIVELKNTNTIKISRQLMYLNLVFKELWPRHVVRGTFYSWTLMAVMGQFLNDLKNIFGYFSLFIGLWSPICMQYADISWTLVSTLQYFSSP